MAAKLLSAKEWQRVRAILLHKHFLAAETRMQVEGLALKQALQQICATVRGTILRAGTREKVLKVSLGGIKANYYRWKAGGKTAEALLLDYSPGASVQRVPRALIAEAHRRATLPGMAHIAVVYDSLVADWRARRPIPGLQLWEGDHAPDFPFSRSAFYKHQPTPAERALGNKGFAEFKKHSPFVSLNYSNLRKCELFVLDDVRIDVMVIDAATAMPVELKAYIMMEAGSRFIPGYILKPASAIKQEDVDELIAHTLTVTGWGRGYTTHIKLERGTVAMSEAAQSLLESITRDGTGGSRLKIHRTGMNGGVRWIGSHADKKSGHWMGKAVIESFMRKLHLSLMTIPGQRGNNASNQPANLGLETTSKFTAGSLLDEATKLAQFQLALDRSGERVRLRLPMLYLHQFERIFKAAIHKHNHESGHNYQGHGTFFEAEVQPGIWSEIKP